MKDDFAKTHAVGYCLKPKDMGIMPLLSASKEFMAPKRIDCRDFLTPTEDQKSKPWCAAYSAANWAEAIMWRRNDTFEQIKPDWIYEYAKQHDGMPNTDGTTLTAALEALRGTIFDSDTTKVRIVKPNRISLRYAIHKYGIILGGFNITPDWYSCTKEDPVIREDHADQLLGGHAVIIPYYDKQGVWISNSWGAGWGAYGLGFVPWTLFDRTFVYGAVLCGVLNDMDIVR